MAEETGLIIPMRIRIPMEFVQGMTVNSKDAAIVDSIIALSHKMG